MNSRRSRSKRSLEDDSSWSLTYVDVLSLLLCFSVIFFQVKDKSLEQKIIAEVSAKLNSPSNKNQPRENARQKEAIEFEDIRQRLGSFMTAGMVPSLDPKKNELTLNFPGVEFFASGDYRLSPKASLTLGGISEVLLPWKQDIYIKIKGHTDPRQISKNRRKYEDNWELSSMRAVSGLRVFLKVGFPPGQLAAEGVAENDPGDLSDDSGKRRLTITITTKQ